VHFRLSQSAGKTVSHCHVLVIDTALNIFLYSLARYPKSLLIKQTGDHFPLSQGYQPYVFHLSQDVRVLRTVTQIEG